MLKTLKFFKSFNAQLKKSKIFNFPQPQLKPRQNRAKKCFNCVCETSTHARDFHHAYTFRNSKRTKGNEEEEDKA